MDLEEEIEATIKNGLMIAQSIIRPFLVRLYIFLHAGHRR